MIWTTLGVTRYRHMTINVPICDRCARAQYVWFGAAALVGGTIFLPIPLWTTTPDALAVVAVLAVTLAIVGTRARPLKIVKWDEKTNRLTLDIASKDVAAALTRGSAGGRRATGGA